MTDSLTAISAIASTSPPSSSSHSRRCWLSGPATRSRTSAIARCSPRSIRSSAEPRRGRDVPAPALGRRRPRSATELVMGASAARARLPDRDGRRDARPRRAVMGWLPRPTGPVRLERSFDLGTGSGRCRRPAAMGDRDGGAGAGERVAATSRSRRRGRSLGGRRDRLSRAPPGLVTKASWESVSDRRGSASRVTVTRISRRGSRVPKNTMRAAPAAAPRRSPRAMKASSLTVTRGQGPRCPAPPGAPSPWPSVAARHGRVKSTARRLREPAAERARGADGRLTVRADPGSPAPLAVDRPHRRREVQPRLDPRRPPGVPRPAGRRFLAPVQHRVPGGLPGRHELPRLPQPRRRGPVRGGLHPVPRAEPRGRDVLVRLLGAVRARVPPRRHRPARSPSAR